MIIKFRAWDNETKQMLTVKNINFCGEEINSYEMTGDWIGLDVVELMQYTGLKDKNGKEIYEGDICKGIRNIPFVVEWDDENARFLGYGTKGYVGYVSKYPKVEVIGNIYENPELLKESEDEV